MAGVGLILAWTVAARTAVTAAAHLLPLLRNPSSPVAQDIDGSAKVIVAAINQILHDQAGRG